MRRVTRTVEEEDDDMVSGDGLASLNFGDKQREINRNKRQQQSLAS